MHQSDIVPTLEVMAESLTLNGYLVFDYISNIANNDNEGRMLKNQLSREWISRILSELGLVNISFNGLESHRVSVLTFHKPMENSLYFATSNATKVIELQGKCKNHALHLANIDVSEIKDDDIVEVAKDKAKKSFVVLKHPVLVTDGGIFINALNGFPGSNSNRRLRFWDRPNFWHCWMANSIGRPPVGIVWYIMTVRNIGYVSPRFR